eukprot:TRINITY_DN3203_c1_g2_i1.p1 TRINITY_DN3203_c1_g2~~TRINITY_DN3203_c1_g2_i1.p1  ORF type:complete len:321 (-),score=105.34 TRINITY_DN3203_c1_g2_i1:309-1247(-)
MISAVANWFGFGESTSASSSPTLSSSSSSSSPSSTSSSTSSASSIVSKLMAPFKGTTLLVPPSSSHSAFSQCQSLFETIAKENKNATIAADVSKLSIKSEQCDCIISVMDAESVKLDVLSRFMDMLSSGGCAALLIPSKSADANVSKQLMYCGFVDMTSVNTLMGSIECVAYSARKPPWQLGSSATLKSASTILASSSAISSSSTSSKVSISSQDLADPELVTKKDDTKTEEKPKVCASRRPCKNCSCGRAARQNVQQAKDTAAKSDTKTAELKTTVSACGNCGLGDDFRCASCPYKGLPKFKPGEVVKLQL